MMVTAMQRYTEQKTPKAELYLRALIDLGKDMGNSTPKAKMVPQNFCPQNSSTMKESRFGAKIWMILGIAPLIYV
jgi:hypothetical protein